MKSDKKYPVCVVCDQVVDTSLYDSYCPACGDDTIIKWKSGDKYRDIFRFNSAVDYEDFIIGSGGLLPFCTSLDAYDADRLINEPVKFFLADP